MEAIPCSFYVMGENAPSGTCTAFRASSYCIKLPTRTGTPRFPKGLEAHKSNCSLSESAHMLADHSCSRVLRGVGVMRALAISPAMLFAVLGLNPLPLLDFLRATAPIEIPSNWVTH